MVQPWGTYLPDSFTRCRTSCEGDECISSILACHGVHHKTQVPDFATFFKQRDQLILIQFLRNLSTEHLQLVLIRHIFPAWSLSWSSRDWLSPTTSHMTYNEVQHQNCSPHILDQEVDPPNLAVGLHIFVGLWSHLECSLCAQVSLSGCLHLDLFPDWQPYYLLWGQKLQKD